MTSPRRFGGPQAGAGRPQRYLRVHCTKCGAPVGQRCTSRTGQTATHAHQERRDLYAATFGGGATPAASPSSAAGG